MTSEQNKQTIRRMFDAQLANDLETYSQILADDLKWEIMQAGIERPRTKPEMLTMLQAVHRSLNGGLWEKHVVHMVAEANFVACEATARMQLSNGNLYEQRYHYVYRLRDGQVIEVREYLDTLAASKAFEGLTVVPEEDGEP